MENIFEPDNTFDFNKLSLGTPYDIYKGTFFTKLFYNNKPFFIQTPKSFTKQGFIKNKKKTYCDLMFTNNDDIFINWVENLEAMCHDLLYQKSADWFENKMEKADIETTFQSPLKLFKSGRFYLLKTGVKNGIKIYNENNSIVSQDEITTENMIISIVEVQGIEFTRRNFQIEFEIKQVMLVSPDPFLDACFIKTITPKQNSLSTLLLNDSSQPLKNTERKKEEEEEKVSNEKLVLETDMGMNMNIETRQEHTVKNDNDKENEPDSFAEELIQNFESKRSSIPSFDHSKRLEKKKDTHNTSKKAKIRFSEDTIDNSHNVKTTAPHYEDNCYEESDTIVILDDIYGSDTLDVEDLDLSCDIPQINSCVDNNERGVDTILETRVELSKQKEKDEEKKRQYEKYRTFVEESEKLRRESIRVYLEARKLMDDFQFTSDETYSSTIKNMEEFCFKQ